MKAAGGLKMNKASGCDVVQPQHVKYKGCGLTLYLSTGFTMFLHHSIALKQYDASYVVPAVKDRIGDTADVNNYRRITVSSVVFKVI